MLPHQNNNVKCQEALDQETGEISRFEYRTVKGERVPVAAYDQDAADLDRWILHGHARRLLRGLELRERRVRVPYTELTVACSVESRRVIYVPLRERYYLETEYYKGVTGGLATGIKQAPKYRVTDCCRAKIGKEAPEIWFSSASNRASYHKVGVCGSVWVCPVCSRRINLERQRQIQMAYDLVIDQGAGDAVMVTLTVRHGLGDDLGDMLSMLKEADRVMQRSYAYKRMIGYSRTINKVRTWVDSPLAYIGRIGATEITHGKNGWHPHVHQLWFFDRKLSGQEINKMRRELFKEWKAACVSVGLPAPLEYDRSGRPVGVDARRALSAAEYLSKFGHDREWGPEKELAAQHVKSGKRKGRTAFQLLYDYGQGDKQSGALFAVFAAATLGRHQLEFSKRLRVRLVELGIKDVEASDEELAAKQAEDSRHLGTLTDDDFSAICGAEKFGIEAHGTALIMAKKHGFDAAVSWIRSLPSYRGSARLDRVKSETAQYEKAAALHAREFWSWLNAAGGSAELERRAGSLVLFESDPGVLAREWRVLRLEAESLWRGARVTATIEERVMFKPVVVSAPVDDSTVADW